jgi:hypothetical protein
LGCLDSVDKQLNNLLLNFVIFALIQPVEDDDGKEGKRGYCLRERPSEEPLKLDRHRAPRDEFIVLHCLLHWKVKCKDRGRKLVRNGWEQATPCSAFRIPAPEEE